MALLKDGAAGVALWCAPANARDLARRIKESRESFPASIQDEDDVLGFVIWIWMKELAEKQYGR